MKKLIIPALLIATASAMPAFADDNIANCEIVVQQPVLENDTGAEAPMIATFLPAGDFVFSVFDGEDGHLQEVDGKIIRALMCVRTNLIPTEFDVKLAGTGVPLYLSQDFDSKQSALMSVYKKGENYVYDYTGPDLSGDDKDIIKLRLEALNNAQD